MSVAKLTNSVGKRIEAHLSPGKHLVVVFACCGNYVTRKQSTRAGFGPTLPPV